MPSARERMTTMAQIGPIKFWARTAPFGGERNVATYPEIGGEGADTEDFGAGARAHPITAQIEEDVFLKLYNLMDEGKVLDCVHPVFGVMRARLVKCHAELPLADGADVSLTLLEHGLRWTNPPPQSMSAAAAKARGIMDPDDPFYQGLGDLPSTAGMPDALGDSMGTVLTSWGSFEAVITTVQQGLAAYEEVSAAYADLVASCDDLVGNIEASVDAIASAPADMAAAVTLAVDTGLYDVAFELMAAARDCVDAAADPTTTTWRAYRSVGAITMAEIADEFLGGATQTNIDAILRANPSIIDAGAIAGGVELRLPV